MFVLRQLPVAKHVFVAAVLGAALFPVAGAAAEWQKVMAGRTELIEIDKSRIVHGMGGTTGWSRILLGQDVRDPGGAYNQIHAQNLYDCEGRRFTTLRRAYFSGDNFVREEAASRQKANSVQAGSIDERLLNEACAGRPAGSEPGLLAAIGRTLQNAMDPERPQAMHADMRSASGESGGRIAPVADAAPKPAAPAAASEPASAPGAPAQGERHKLIALPPIDKAAAEAAANAAAKQAGAPAGNGTKPGEKADKTDAKAKPEAKPGMAATAKAAGAAAATETLDERRLRELQYATSGPSRKSPKKKAQDEHGANPAAQMHAHWAYEGAGGPANWGRLQPDFAACATGKRQSPIDIRDGVKVGLETIRFEYKPTSFRIVDNGHTLQINVGEGLGLRIMGKRYELVQFHFHKPSEERVNGKTFDMVVHLVHRNDEGQLAVVAVLLEKGAEHPLIQTLWNNMPLDKDLEVAPVEAIDPAQLLPENRAYWTYMGSLTTPPCTEGVLWMVIKQPQQVSGEQVSVFSRLYKNNARPVQPSNGRLIKESR